jgi:hypothetical protein
LYAVHNIGDGASLQVKTGRKPVSVREGAGPVTTVHQFHRDARITRNGVDYVFRRSGVPAAASRSDLDAARTRLAAYVAAELSREAVGRRALAIYSNVLERRVAR